MQSIEEFMLEYFQARSAEIKRDLAERAVFRQKYFANDCLWDSRTGVLERSESESVESVSGSDDIFLVISSNENLPKRLRYHIAAEGIRWLIQEVEVECLYCKSEGDTSCVFCRGTGWLGSDNVEARIRLRLGYFGRPRGES
jgi:hypothetical protein